VGRSTTGTARYSPQPSRSHLCLIPDGKSRPEELAAGAGRLKAVLNLAEKDLVNIRSRIESGDTFIYVKRKISWDQADRIAKLNLKNLYIQKESRRSYPLGTLAAHVLGGVNIDGAGQSGLELSTTPARGGGGRAWS
jgi:cell division protein FtsI/penicillin-binding protein 2